MKNLLLEEVEYQIVKTRFGVWRLPAPISPSFVPVPSSWDCRCCTTHGEFVRIRGGESSPGAGRQYCPLRSTSRYSRRRISVS